MKNGFDRLIISLPAGPKSINAMGYVSIVGFDHEIIDDETCYV
jgi:hypothetical protein